MIQRPPSPHPRPLRRLAAVLLAGAATTLTGVLVSWACGPFFAAWMVDNEENLTKSPVAFLRDELTRIKPASTSPFKAKPADGTVFRQTYETEQTELEAALTQGKVGPEARRELLRQVGELRVLMVPRPNEYEAGAETDAAKPPLPQPPAGAKPAVPKGLPAEFDDYLRGAEAYHRGDLAAARKAWNQLLGRPAAERRYRSTWAAYMIGRSFADTDPAEAAKWFEKTRKLAADKLPDSLGLATASYGWQARGEMRRGHPEEALDLYMTQVAAGDPSAARSVRVVAGRILADPKLAASAVKSSRNCAILAAYVISRWDQESWDGTGAEAAGKTLLAALKGTKVGKSEGADRLAWAAYRSGNFADAEAWLAQTEEKTPTGEWIRAKLLIRAGKMDEAENLLESIRGNLPPGLKADKDLADAYDVTAPIAALPRASGELGFLRLAQGQFQEALIALLHGGYWTDASYIAERVLSVDELKTLVDRRYPSELAAKYKRPTEFDDVSLYAGLAEPSEERTAYQMRYLLGRRLGRSGRYADALDYLPAAQKATMRDFNESLSIGRTASRAGDERARKLLRAACLARYHGMELFGTEGDPDWFQFDGSYDPGRFVDLRAAPKLHPHTKATKEELRRVAGSVLDPDKRFHYRYRAAALGVEAATLFPEGSNDKAVMLAAAGTWIKALEAQTAQPIYKMLVTCCSKSAVGKDAVKLKWFPTVNACPADTRPKQDRDPN